MINLASKDISHSLGKFIVTAIGVGMLLGIVLIMIGVYRGMIVDAKSLLNDINADIWVVQQDTLGPFAQSSRLYEDLKHQIISIEGVTETAALTFQTLQIRKDKKMIRTTAIGYEIGKMGRPARIIKGREILKDHYEIVTDAKLGFDINDKIRLGRDIYTVVGITKGAIFNNGEPLVFLNLKDQQKLQFLFSNETIRNDRARGINVTNSNIVNAIVAKVTKGYDIKKITEYIKRWKHKSAYTNDEEIVILTKNLIEMSSKQIGLFTIILIIVSSVIISLIIYTMTIGKIKEIAILKLIGIPNFIIVKMIMQESLVLGILAFIAGNIFAHLIWNKFPKNTVLLPIDALMLFGIVVLVSVLGSLSGVYRATKANPAEAIGE